MTSGRRFSVLIGLAIGVLTVLVVGCSSSDSEGPDGPTVTATASDGGVASGGGDASGGGGGAVDRGPLCGDADHGPCQRSEVDEAVLDLESGYAAEVLERVRSEGYAAAVEWIVAQPEVVEAEGREGILMFRLDGGMPLFVVEPIEQQEPVASLPAGGAPPSDARTAESDTAVAGQTDGAAVLQFGTSTGGTTSIQFEAPSAGGPTPTLAPGRVVGEGTARDNPQNRKKALFLTPYDWQGLSMFQTTFPDPVEHLRTIPDYNHDPSDVDHQKDDEVTPRSFQGWKDLDAIFIETHGGIIGVHTFFSTGVIQEWDPDSPSGTFRATCDSLMDPYSDLTGLDCGIVPVGEQQYIAVGLLPSFFAREYGAAGLQSAIIYVGGCYSGANDDTAGILAGSSSAYVGWTALTYLPQERASAALLVWLLILNGRGETIEGALRTLANEGRHGGADFGPSEGGSFVGFFPPGGTAQKNLRLYSVPTLRDPESTPGLDTGPGLLDGATLRIQGTINDGIDDAIEIAVDLFGIIDPENSGASADGFNDIALQNGDAADLYNLRFFLDDQDIGADNLGRKLNPTAEVFELGDGIYRYVFTADLPFDVETEGQELPLKVVVDLPEGGQSDYEVDVKLVSFTGAVISVGGQTWEFELSDFFGGCIGDANAVLASGAVDGDSTNGVTFSADLRAGGRGDLTVDVPSSGQKWMAAADRDGMTTLHLVTDGHSQIDSLTFEGNRVFGNATFIDTVAFREAEFYNTAHPGPVQGSFEITCPQDLEDDE